MVKIESKAAQPWLICQTKPARFLEVSDKILQDNALFLQKLSKILQKVQEMQELWRFLQETCKNFLEFQDNSVLTRFLRGIF